MTTTPVQSRAAARADLAERARAARVTYRAARAAVLAAVPATFLFALADAVARALTARATHYVALADRATAARDTYHAALAAARAERAADQ